MSPKMHSVAFLILITCAPSAVASEGAIFNSVENTLTIPVVNVGDQGFYYLELSFSPSETDIRLTIEEAREIDRPGNSNAYFSTATSRLSVSNVDVGGDQWILNLDLVQGSSQFIVESMLLPTLDTEGRISEVEYLDNSMERYIYRFDEAGKIENIEDQWQVFSFQADSTVTVFANYGAPGFGTDLGEMDAGDVGSAISLYYFFESIRQLHHSEITSSELDYHAFPALNRNFQPLANALSIPSWIFACAYAAGSTNSWESIVKACESPSN